MGRLRTLTILMILGAWGSATDGAPPNDAAPPSRAARPPAPVAPVKYLEAATRLYERGDTALAAKYFKAAQMYRDELSAKDQAMLDAYLKEMTKAAPADAAVAPAVASTTTPVAATEAVAAEPAAAMPSPAAGATADLEGPSPHTATGKKQRGRWLLLTAREMIRKGEYDSAEKFVAEARALNIHWGLFDDTPAKVTETLEKARPKAVASAEPAGTPHDRKTAKVRLMEARAALANNEFQQAEAIALDVKSWNLTYGVFEDNPDKVAAAARALRHRDSMRRSSPRDRSSQSVYDTLVQESRKLMAEGQYDLAEAKAKKAQGMNVVPGVTTDRAEDVLHDVAMARARKGPAAEPPSAVAEREANQLLAKGDNAAAAAMFAEADRLKQQEAVAGGARLPVDDPAVRKVTGDDAQGVQALPGPGAAAPDQGALRAPEAAAPANRGETLLAEAKALYAGGNYPAAKQLATQAKESQTGVDAQADELIAQVALAEQGGALALYESALNAVRGQNYTLARDLLTEVSAAGATLDEGLMQKVQDLLAKLPKEAAGRATATDLRAAQDADTLAAQKLNAEVSTKIAEARHLQDIDPDKALTIYQDTLRSVKAADIPEALARTMVRRLEVAIELAKKDKAAFDIKMQDKVARAEIEQKRLRIFEADKAKKMRMKEFMDKATTALSEGKYDEAEAWALKAQEVEPNDVTPSIVAFKAKMERRYKTNIKNRDAKENGAVVAMQEVEAASIMDPELQIRGIKVPQTFKDLTAHRREMNERIQPKKSPKTLAIEKKLNELVDCNMANQPLSEAMGYLANYTGTNIVLDPKALNDEGVTNASPVSLVATKISLRTALKLLLKPMGLTYHIDDEVLLITSPQASQSQTFARTYYVGDLIFTPQQQNSGNPWDITSQAHLIPEAPPSNNLQAKMALGGGMPGGLGAAGGMTTNKGERPKVDMSPLISLITASIAPNTWTVHTPEGNDVSSAYGLGGGFGGDAGGVDNNQPIGSITPFFLTISLIIRHTAEIHEQVADLLRQLRRLQDLQVSIEIRFISLSDSFFEQIGVDFDFSIQSDALGKHSTFAVPNAATSLFPVATTAGTTTTTTGTTGGIGGTGGTTGGLGGTTGGTLGGGTGGGTLGGTTGGTTGASLPPPVIVNPLRDNTLGNRLPLVVGTSAGGVGNFSPDLQMPFTQGSAGLIAPSNATAGAGATFGIAFLSDLEVYLFLTAAQGDTRSNVLQAPKVTTFNGAMASIFNTQVTYYIASLIPLVGPGSVAFEPTPAPFPNGVFMFVTPVVSADRRYVRMTLSPNFTALQGFTTLQVPAAVGGSGLGGGSAAINGTIQLPNFTITTVSTTVTVPDGGTVLLGGVKKLNEERKEFGVPVLSKVPMLNRLFRNIGIGRTTTSLMIMVTPRIIILEEEEERLGIPTISL